MKAQTKISIADLKRVGARNAVEAASMVNRDLNGRFLLRFKRRVVPMILHRVNLHGHLLFVFQIGYDVDETTGFSGMRLIVGLCSEYAEMVVSPVNPRVPNDAYIGLIHALPKHGWKGSDMVELALDIARALGVTRATLHDQATQSCTETSAKDDAGYDLSLVMLLSRQITFYGRFGFRPVVRTLSDRGVLTSGDTITDLCSALGKLKRVQTTSLIQYLRAMLRLLDPPGDKMTVATTHGYRLLRNSITNWGVHQTYVMNDADLRVTIPLRIPLMRRLLEAFKGHKGTFLGLFEGTKLSCATKSDFLELLKMDWPILRLGLKGSAKKGTPDIQWPAWSHLHKVLWIRNMYMEAVVQTDPALQRVSTSCPSG